MLRKILLLFNLFILTTFLLQYSCGNDPISTDSSTLEKEVNFIMSRYVKVGGIVGIIDKNQSKHIFSYGSKTLTTIVAPDENTIFEIGSITKTFTAVLAANVYLSGNFTDDTVGHYLPADQVKMPSKDGVEIRIEHLLTHSSGIPRSLQGTGFPYPPGYDHLNPYADYTTEMVYDYFSDYCILEFTPGTWWGYSNTGMGLMGHIVGRVDGSNYETVLHRDIFDVLNMDNSSLFLNRQQMTNLAVGHDEDKNVAKNWDAQDIYQGAGFIKTSLADMFKYLEANLDLVNTPLKEAMELTHVPQFHQGSLGDMALAWYILDLNDGQQIIYHGGGTGGYDTYLGFNREQQTGAIIFFNAKLGNTSVLEIGEEVMKVIYKY